MPEIDSETDLVSLPNQANDCFRNSVLHCLFSLDQFVNLVDAGESMTDRKTYKLLSKLARLFRSGDPSVNTVEAIRPFWTHILKTGGDLTSPAAADPSNIGMKPWGSKDNQEDASDFLEYLLARLCSAEISVDIYEYDRFRG